MWQSAVGVLKFSRQRFSINYIGITDLFIMAARRPIAVQLMARKLADCEYFL